MQRPLGQNALWNANVVEIPARQRVQIAFPR
ncbi:MAG: hypothetical protein BWY52_02307 [Chloroflexi bacterium ADurb.Bin325]|nr:MAG: hypothetical protein BWY52_02307 [Chloroflexi bacterium ADurb.Bin325]